MRHARILVSDVLDGLAQLPDESAQCVITSPPYWGLRDYGCEGQIGLENTPEEYIVKMVAVFREVRRCLRPDGTLWVNMGDCYAGSGRDVNTGDKSGFEGSTETREQSRKARGSTLPAGIQKKSVEAGAIGRAWTPAPEGLKQKDLVGMPWMLAFALRADGWYLRQDIVWSKPNPMPESVTDRCTKAHEYLFLLTKRVRYYCDMEAIKEPCVQDEFRPSFRGGAYCNNATFNNEEGGKSTDVGNIRKPAGWDVSTGNSGHGNFHRLGREDPNSRIHQDIDPAHTTARKNRRLGSKGNEADPGDTRSARGAAFGRGAGWRDDPSTTVAKRNKRSVWTVATQPFAEAHFATFPEALINPCILAGSKVGDTVLDPFCGSGTTGVVALRHDRKFVGIELNPTYAGMAEKRIRDSAPLLNTIEVSTEAAPTSKGKEETLPKTVRS
jgi:DNA modification methylase